MLTINVELCLIALTIPLCVLHCVPFLPSAPIATLTLCAAHSGNPPPLRLVCFGPRAEQRRSQAPHERQGIECDAPLCNQGLEQKVGKNRAGAGRGCLGKAPLPSRPRPLS